MAYQLPEKVRGITPYTPVTGRFDIRLDANESCFTLPGPLRLEAMCRLTEAVEDIHRYPDPYAVECCALMARRCGVDERLIVAGNGSDELISLIAGSLLPKGGRIAVFERDFSMYGFYAALAELELTVLPKRVDGTIDVQAAIEAVRGGGVDLVLFSNPCNPTSLLLPAEDVLRLVRETQALIVVDEAYMEFSDGSVLGEIGKQENLLILKTCSKAVGLAGARMGFAIGPEPLIGALKAAKSPYNVNALSQALVAAVLGDGAYLDACAEKLRDYTAGLYEGISALAARHVGKLGAPARPQTNFVYCAAPRAAEIAAGLAERGIAVRAFSGFLRISTGTPGENLILFNVLEEVLLGLG